MAGHRHRREGHRLAHRYLKLQPHLATKLAALESELLGRPRGATRGSRGGGALLGVHLRGSDKVPPQMYLRYCALCPVLLEPLASHPGCGVRAAPDDATDASHWL